MNPDLAEFYQCGAAIMTNSTINKHIFKSKHFKGRMIAIDLAFKGKTFFRIINVYLPANTTNKQDIKLRYEVHKECEKWITEATNLKYNVLLMGDFNADPDKYKKIKKNHHLNLNSQIYHKYNIFNITKQFKLLDLAKLHQSKALTTWSDASNTVHTRIDLMFATTEFIKESLYTHLIDTSLDQILKTDHKCICTLFSDSFFYKRTSNQKKATDKKLNPKPTPNYHRMTRSEERRVGKE